MWRCFLANQVTPKRYNIFSTYVEVFLEQAQLPPNPDDFLHVCGGVSPEAFAYAERILFSPRMWRCFLLNTAGLIRKWIFSTYVEVFLYLLRFSLV